MAARIAQRSQHRLHPTLVHLLQSAPPQAVFAAGSKLTIRALNKHQVGQPSGLRQAAAGYV